MSQEERHGDRDRTYSAWHRKNSLQRFVDGGQAEALSMIDLDVVIWMEVHRVTKEPLLLIETARDVGQAFKPAAATKRLGERANLPVLVVLYKPSDRQNPADSGEFDIESFRVQVLGPRHLEMGHREWLKMSPQEYAEFLVNLRSFPARLIENAIAETLAEWERGKSTMPPTIFIPKDRTRREHVGMLDEVKYRNDDRPRVILRLTDGASMIGPALADQFVRGQKYVFFGRWKDGQRGCDFHFDTVVRDQPLTREAVTRYLADSCQGIGAVTAERLFQKYGADAVATLRKEPRTVADAGIMALDAAERAASDLERFAHVERTKIALVGMFGGRGFPGHLIDACIGAWGVRAPELIRRNPFALLVRRMPGCSFKRVDKLYLETGGRHGSLKRQAMCAVNIIRQDHSGSTWLDADAVAADLTRAVPGADPWRALILLRRGQWVRVRRQDGRRFVALRERADAEMRIADNVRRLSRFPAAWPTEIPASATEGDGLPTAHQVAELKKATAGAVGCFVGGPGTGKTYALSFLLKALIAERGPDAVAVAAPTGKAAVRAGESLRARGIDMLARTQHQLLEIGRNGHDGDGWGFERNRDNPLDVAALVIDECFVRGTLVDTPRGQVPIESIVPGDKVYSATGCDTVRGTSRKEVDHAVRVTAGKATFVCSENHPFLTTRGWVRAHDLGPDDTLVQAAEAVRLVRGDHYAEGYERWPASLLRACLLREMVDAVPRTESKVPLARGEGEERSRSVRVPAIGFAGSQRPGGSHPAVEPDVESGESRTVVSDAEGNRAQAGDQGRERAGFNRAAAVAAQRTRTGLGDGVPGEDARQEVRLPLVLQAGPGVGRSDDRDRNRRAVAPRDGCEGEGREEGPDARFTRVDRVEVLERGSAELDQYRDADGRIYLYDLAVTRHPSFSVNGHLVHNCSMDDASLLADTLDAVPDGGCVLFVGDAAQLPPVGHGAPLRDLLAGGIPQGELTEIHRNAGSIVEACAAIKAGTAVRFDERFDLAAPCPRNLRLLDCAAEECLDVLADVIGQMSRFDPIWETQIITPLNDKAASTVTRAKINGRFGPVFNPDGRGAKGNPFRVGDKVICTVNTRLKVVVPVADRYRDPDMALDAANYQTVAGDRRGNESEWYVANGEVGRVVAVSKDATVARFGGVNVPLVRFSHTRVRESDDEDKKAAAAGGDFEPAWAVTCHKYQGSEVPCAVLMVDPEASSICDMNYWYTAISRARSACLLIGPKGAFEKQVKRVALTRRRTFLGELLRDGL